MHTARKSICMHACTRENQVEQEEDVLSQAMPYSIQPAGSGRFPNTYVITMGNELPFHATVASTNSGVREWVFLAMSRRQRGVREGVNTIGIQQVNTVGIHVEPRRLNPRLIPGFLQPEPAVLIVAFGRRVLLLRLVHDQELPEILVNHILRKDRFNFVGMDIESIIERLGARGRRLDILHNVRDIRVLAAEHTGREHLRTAGLKTIVRAVLGFDLERWPRLMILPHRWSSENLSEELIMHGGIRAFMAVRVSQSCVTGTTASSSSSAQQETHLDQSHDN